DRFRWLIMSRNEYPPVPFHLDVRALAKNVSDSAFLLGLFELGPIAAFIALYAAARRWASHRAETQLLLGMGLATLAFSLLFSGGKILAVFLIPGFLVFAVFVAQGLEPAMEWLGPRLAGHSRAVLAIALLAAGMLVAHGARLLAYEHPFGPLESRVIEEDDMPQHRLFPSMRHVTEPRTFIESAAASLPDSALVICEWREFMAMLYLQRVEYRRRDLTVQPSGYPKLLLKVADWQRRYDLESHPVVVVSPIALMQPHLGAAQPMQLATGQRVLLTYQALDVAPPLAHATKAPVPAGPDASMDSVSAQRQSNLTVRKVLALPPLSRR
ncbi:MAG: hypothetical protein K8R56_02040, partial [Candidatus Eisenbacteria bacterium]|nr:hypothetical protein [Candidatus Eisenbacteria bacterium]